MAVTGKPRPCMNCGDGRNPHESADSYWRNGRRVLPCTAPGCVCSDYRGRTLLDRLTGRVAPSPTLPPPALRT